MSIFFCSSLSKMEIFLIKHHDKNAKVLHNYFFSLVDQLTYEKKMNYFISNSIAEQKYTQNYYYSLPFKILTIIYQTMTNNDKDNDNGRYVKLTNTIYLNSLIWSSKYLNEQTVIMYAAKREAMMKMNYMLNCFFEAFLKEKKMTKENIELFTIKFNEETIKDILFKQKDNFLFIDSITDYISLREHDDYVEYNGDDKRNYVDLLREFLKNSLQLFKVLSTSGTTNYDYFENSREYEVLKYIEVKKVKITKVYANLILQLVFGDVYCAMTRYLWDIVNENKKKINFIEEEEGGRNEELFTEYGFY